MFHITTSAHIKVKTKFFFISSHRIVRLYKDQFVKNSPVDIHARQQQHTPQQMRRIYLRYKATPSEDTL
jgi:hypothetical protein